MDWRIKAGLQKVLAYTRIGDKLNHIPVLLKSNYHENVVKYQLYETIRKYSYTAIDLKQKCEALEIGTGYSLVSPIVLSLLGFQNIITVDISKDVTFKTLKAQMHFLNSDVYITKIAKQSVFSFQDIKKKMKYIVEAPSLEKVLSFCNIEYIAPYNLNALAGKLPKFDYICSQVVFEHIEPSFLSLLVKHIKMWLKKGAYTVHTVNFVDHFTNPGPFQDKRISEYNFLKFSDAYWKFWAGNAIAYTNRLSYCFYENLFITNKLNIKEFIGENYKPSKPLSLDTIHEDVLRLYTVRPEREELVKFQRGTFIVINGV